MIKKTLLVTCMAAFLGGCGEGSGSKGVAGYDGFSMPGSEPVAEAALPIPPVATSPYVASIATNSEAIVTVPDSDSSELITRSDFLFDTSRAVHLKVDLADAAGMQGILSVCTDFQETTSGFDVNYKSCPVRGTIANGEFEKDISLMNQFDSVIAVIWFQNQAIAPLYKKFETTELVQSANGQEWVWN